MVYGNSFDRNSENSYLIGLKWELLLIFFCTLTNYVTAYRAIQHGGEVCFILGSKC